MPVSTGGWSAKRRIKGGSGRPACSWRSVLISNRGPVLMPRCLSHGHKAEFHDCWPTLIVGQLIAQVHGGACADIVEMGFQEGIGSLAPHIP